MDAKSRIKTRDATVEDAALMKIDPFPWAAPLEELKLKRP